MRKKIVKKSLSILLCITMLCIVAFSTPNVRVDVAAMTYSELQDKLAGYEAKQKELQGKIDSLKKDKGKYNELKESLDSQISSMQSQIDLVNDRITALNTKIANNEAKIKRKQQKLKDTKELLRSRLRALYVAGHSSELLVLLGAEDFSTMLSSTQLMRSVTEHDTNLMETISKDIKSIKRMKRKIEKEKIEATSLKSTLVTKQQQLDKQFSDVQGVLNKLGNQQNSLEEQKEDVIAAQKAAEQAWEEAQKHVDTNQQFDTGGVPVSKGIFAWPFQSSYYISANYGRYSWGGAHTGVDITCSGAYGKPIYASAAGTVIKATYMNYSYGNHIIINHGNYNGNNYQSLYAHNSRLLVSVGQKVSRGQLIAYCGSSGNSTGAHLHFEIRVNGSHVNPMSYFR